MKLQILIRTLYAVIIVVAWSHCFAAKAKGVAFMQGAEMITDRDFASGNLRGFNIGWLDNTRKEKYYADMAWTGANLARTLMRLERCATCETYELQESDLHKLDALLEMGVKYGFKVVIGLRIPDEDRRNNLWRNVSLQKSFIRVWKSIAIKYHANRTIAGYDLLNEPVPPGITFDIRQHKWLMFAEMLVREIRLIDPYHVVIIEPAPDSTPWAFKNMKPLLFKNIVYSLHFYIPMEITHQGVTSQWTGTIPYPSSQDSEIGLWDKNRLLQLMETVDDFSRNYNVPIYVGEFSCVRWAPGGSALRYINDVLEIMTQKSWSWTYHEFRGWHGWDPEIESPMIDSRDRSKFAPVMSLLNRYLRTRLFGVPAESVNNN